MHISLLTFCSSSLPSWSKRKTLKARCRMPLGVPGTNRCDRYLFTCPTIWSSSSKAITYRYQIGMSCSSKLTQCLSVRHAGSTKSLNETGRVPSTTAGNELLREWVAALGIAGVSGDAANHLMKIREQYIIMIRYLVFNHEVLLAHARAIPCCHPCCRISAAGHTLASTHRRVFLGLLSVDEANITHGTPQPPPVFVMRRVHSKFQIQISNTQP